MARYKAVVAGALGVIGRSLVEHLDTLDDWDVVGLSRRGPDFETKARFISVDLTDAADTRAKLAELHDVTHVFFAAFQYRTVWVETLAPNLAMLVNCVEAIEAASPGLRHVNLAQGTKYYGAHLGPFKTPARESDPPHMAPSFYVEQQRWLEARQPKASWTWSAVRPHTVCGYARGNPMNLANVIGVYAAMSKELGLPLRYPGKRGAYHSVYQLSDAKLLARQMVWCATTPNAENEAFNTTNGDYMRWENLWPRIAELFDMPVGRVQTIPLGQFMQDKAPLWERIQKKHDLQPIPMDELVDWGFGDYIFGCDWDIMSSTVKIRQAGFHECLDSEEAMLGLLKEMREMRILP